MTKLSVNVNKIATLRNARGGDNPNVARVALDCVRFGADGITVHPRPDERHIRPADVYLLKSYLKTEFNIEGYPSEDFLSLVASVKPTQVTLVPDTPEQLTSNHGWDIEANYGFLRGVVDKLHELGIRTSLFIDANPRMVEHAKSLGVDRVELYTEPYASSYDIDRVVAIRPFIEAAKAAKECNLGLNAGHDLNLDNLTYLKHSIPWLDEVSVGHALICDSLYMGLEKTIKEYKKCLQ